MLFNRQNKSIRVWFQAVRNTGVLRAGLVSSDFVVTVINSSDTAFISPFVTESVQRPGNYYFDVTSSFFVTNGIGDYNVSIEIDAQTAPTVRSAMAETLRISREDFDSLSGSIWNTSGSEFNVSGTMGYLLNQAAGQTINITASIDVPSVVSGVWNAQGSTFNNSGTMGYFQNMMDEVSSSVAFIRGIEAGTWIITGSQMVFYESGTLIEIARFNLQDINGIAIDPATQNPFRRIAT